MRKHDDSADKMAELAAASEAKLAAATDMYEYRDLSGQNGAIRHADVKQILKQ
jgi:hypothetical protein